MFVYVGTEYFSFISVAVAQEVQSATSLPWLLKSLRKMRHIEAFLEQTLQNLHVSEGLTSIIVILLRREGNFKAPVRVLLNFQLVKL